MIALLQRVSHADVCVDNKKIADIGRGILAFIAIEHHDTELQANRLLKRLLGYRIFSDDRNKMNLSLIDIGGGLLLVPQFTLAADTNKGLRPSFTSAASTEQGQRLFNYFCQKADQSHNDVSKGVYGAEMQVSLTNDGPATFWLQI